MEPRFGHDFSRVQVHADARAAQSARAAQALAYTVGSHIVFGAGQYDPRSVPGRKLLAHELTHVLQQSGTTTAPRALSIDPADSAAEREAEALAAREGPARHDDAGIAGDAAAPIPVTPSGPRLQMQRRGYAGGCGICMGGDPRYVGRIVHEEIQDVFVALDPDINPEYPVQVVPEDETPPFTPRLDLAKEEAQSHYGRVIHIGEIKPLDDAGKQVGIARNILADYARELSATFDEVFRLRLPPPPPAPLFNPRNPPGCPPQRIIIQLTEPGIYQYYCEPPWSELRRLPTCQQCEGEPVRHPFPVPVWELVFLALMAGAAAKWRNQLKKLVPPLAAATAAATLIAFLQGKKIAFAAGEDPLEAVFDASAKKGAPIPDDVKDAIRKDAALSDLVKNVASGKTDPTEAERQISEQAMRILIENRDKFSDADIEELAKIVNQSKAVSHPVTAEDLRREIDAAKAGAKPAGGQGTAPAIPEKSPSPKAAAAPALSGPVAKRLASDLAAKEIIDELSASADGGAKINDAFAEALLSLTKNARPPLTKAEAAELAAAIRFRKDMKPDEILESISAAIARRRPAAPGSQPTSPGGPAAPETAPPVSIPVPPPDTMTKAMEATERVVAEKKAAKAAKDKLKSIKPDSLKEGEIRVLPVSLDPKIKIVHGTSLPSVWVIGKKAGQLWAAILSPVADQPGQDPSQEIWLVQTPATRMYDSGGNVIAQLPSGKFSVQVIRKK